MTGSTVQRTEANARDVYDVETGRRDEIHDFGVFGWKLATFANLTLAQTRLGNQAKSVRFNM